MALQYPHQFQNGTPADAVQVMANLDAARVAIDAATGTAGPAGPTGATGAQGATGPAGPAAANLALNVKDIAFGPGGVYTHGALMDGASHPLSGFFESLAAAQAVYPHAVALTDELDWAAIQLAINTAMGSGVASAVARYPTRAVRVPGGSPVINRTLDILSCNGFRFEGDGAGSTRFYINANLTNVFNCNGTTACTIGGFALRAAFSFTGTATTTSGSTSLTGVTPTTNFKNGSPITGAGIPSGTWIVSGAGTATMVLSKKATASATVTVTSTYGCTTALNVDWVVASAARSSEFCTFYDIDISGEMNFVYGVSIGTTAGGADVYHHRFNGVRVYGGQNAPVAFSGNVTNGSSVITNVSSTAGLVVGMHANGAQIDADIVSIDSSTQITMSANAFGTTTGQKIVQLGWTNATKYQAAFRHGQGAQGNVVFNLFFGCNGAHCRRGFWTTSAGCHWWGGSLQSNGADIYNDGAGNERVLHFDGVRSEVSGCILDGTNGGKQDVSIRNYMFAGDGQLVTSGRVINWAFAGVIRLENVSIEPGPSLVAPVVVLVAPGNPLAFAMLIVDGLSIRTSAPHPVNWLSISSQTAYRVSGVQALNNSQCETMGLVGPVSNQDRTPTAVNYTALPRDKVIGVTSTAAARTITLPAISTVHAGYTITVKDESGGAVTNNITVQRAATDLIEGATTKVIATNYGVAKLMSTGAAWVAV